MNDVLLELRDSARQVVGGAGTPAYEAQTWPMIVELGWLLTAVEEDMDGLGLGIQGACALHGELGRGLTQAPFLAAMMCLEAVSHSELAASEKQAWLERLAAGEFATAPMASPDITLEQGATGAALLSGISCAVQSADRAGHALVWTRDADCVALVGLGQPGVDVIETPTWDTTRRLFELRFKQLALEGQLILAKGPAARQLVTRLETQRDLALAADSLGGAAALLDMTIEHLLTRRQFGRPLAMFQALKHRCADLKTLIAGADALLLDALARVGSRSSEPDAQLMGRKAKYLASSTFSKVAEESLQLHGGIGMAAEHPCHFFLKRAMLNEHLGTRDGGYEQAIADSFLGAQA